jgi:predicted O-methyltransferase YrrM
MPKKALYPNFKGLLRRSIGESLLGEFDYIRFPARKDAWGGPFNGQRFRIALFSELLKRISPAAIIETGTYLGTTTEFMAKAGLPVFTIEERLRNYGFARARLRWHRNVTLLHGDSRDVLRRLLRDRFLELSSKAVFFYLDAHWNPDVPLIEELDIAFGQCPAAVVMVDDFQVPGDPGYGYDDYGSGKALTLDYIAPAVQAHGLAMFYPATRSSEETGARRGCIILARAANQCAELESITLLRRNEQISARHDV